MCHLLNDLSQVVLEGGCVQFLIVTAQGLCRVICPLKPHELLPAHCVRDKKKNGGEVLDVGCGGRGPEQTLATSHPAATLPQQEPEQRLRPGSLADGPWAGLGFPNRRVYLLGMVSSLPLALFTV